mmetsp:Transcript_2562/g.7625  ORF Transcript_2562/g.7625 Transcript_2562/m.7625 type:complete len:230 (-) Transcript_2562:562-1251(-)
MHGRLHHTLTHNNTVMACIKRSEFTQHRDSGTSTGLNNLHGLETTLEGRILVKNEPLVLLVRRRPDAPKLTSCQHRLHEVGRIHIVALGATSSKHQVKLVDEQYLCPIRCTNLRQHRLQALLKVATEPSSGEQGANIQGPHRSAAPHLRRHPSLGNPLRHGLGHGCLANTSGTHEAHIILCTAREDLKHPLNFCIPSDDRIEATTGSLTHEVHSKGCKHRSRALLNLGR